MDEQDYRKTSEECRLAYFQYRKLHPNTSATAFVAGWNAAKNHGEPRKTVDLQDLS